MKKGTTGRDVGEGDLFRVRKLSLDTSDLVFIAGQEIANGIFIRRNHAARDLLNSG